MIGVTQLLNSNLAQAAWAVDIFGDGSNMFTSNFSTSSLSTEEGNGSGFSIATGSVSYDANVPKAGFVKSITMSSNVNGNQLNYNLQTGDSVSDVKAYSFWVYITQHDDDDNLVFNVNLKRQTGSSDPAGYMLVYAYETDRSSYAYDQFNKIAENTWVHICVVDEGSVMRFYKDGSSIGGHNIDNKIILDPIYPRVYYLSDADARNEMFITGLRMFNRSLVQSEVTKLYNENPSY